MTTRTLCSLGALLVVVASLLWWRTLLGGVARNVGTVALVHAGALGPVSEAGDVAGDWAGAEHWLRLALDLQPESITTRLQLARLYSLRQRHDAVLELLHWDGPGSLPDELSLDLWDRSYALLHPQDATSARTCPTERVEGIAPWAVDWAEGERAWIKGHIDAALLAYRRALYHSFGASERRGRDYEFARRAWAERRLAGDPSDVEALFRRGAACRALGAVACASDSSQRLLTGGRPVPTGARLLAAHHLGIEAYRAGNAPLARRYLAEVVGLGAPLPDAIRALRDLGVPVGLGAGQAISGSGVLAVAPTVTVSPASNASPTGWRLIGYSMMPWHNISTDAQLELVLFWAPPGGANRPGPSSDWILLEGIWLQHVRPWNLAPDPGFDWTMACNDCFPYQYSGVYQHLPVGISIARDTSGDSANDLAVRVANRRSARTGLRTAPLPLFRASIFLQAAQVSVSPGSSASIGHDWYGQTGPHSLGSAYPLRSTSTAPSIQAALATPHTNACYIAPSFIVPDGAFSASFDDHLLVPLPDPSRPPSPPAARS